MPTDLETLVVRLEAQLRGYEREMNRARKVTNTALRGVEREASASTARFTAIMTNAGARAGVAFQTGLSVLGAGGLLAGFGITALVDTARQAAAELAKIGDVAERVNVTAEALQALQFASEQNAGSAEAVNSGLQRFAAGLADAKAGSGELKAILDANNVAFTDAKGNLLSTEQALLRFADLVANARSPAEQLELAIRGFGRSAGPELVGLLSQGSGGIREMMKEAKNAGAVLDNELIEKARKIDDKFAEIGTTVKVQVGGAIISVISTIGEFVAALNRAQSATNDLSKASANLPKRIPVVGGSDVHEGDLAADLRNGIARLPNAGGRGTSYDPNDLTPATGPYRPAPPSRAAAPPARPTVLPKSGGGGGAVSEAEKLAESYAKLRQAALARIADLNAEQAALGLTASAAETLRYEQELINRAQQAGIQLSPQQREEIRALAEQYGTLATAVETAADQQAELASLSQNVLGGFVNDLRNGVSAADALANAVNKIADKLLDVALNAVFPTSGGGGFTGLLSGLLGRASGGPVQSGKTYVVGETGPELVRFGRNGTVKPNAVVRSGGQNGGANYAPVYQIDARGAESGVEQKIMAAIKAYDRQNERTLPARIAEINMRRG
ncbi:MAG TPA: hypothetical protein VGU45_05000 [Microvirga sp.]|jgi:hypothetical protein|nr:hypothetical protein [Microvirga sp.]